MPDRMRTSAEPRFQRSRAHTRLMLLFSILAGASVPLTVTETVHAAEVGQIDDDDRSEQRTSPPVTEPLTQALKMKTLGGRQFWGDIYHFRGWRIQYNVVLKHHRLLDADDYRHASGSFKDCLKKLAEIREKEQLPPMRGRAVVFLHGIVRSSKSFGPMYAKVRQAGFHVVPFDYPSTQVTIADSAEFLHQTISSMPDLEEINFVVHSMGGLVVRSYLAKHDDPRFQRMVMIGVPNLGARMADLLRSNPLFKAIMGPAGQQLGSDPMGFIAGLPTPEFEFAVIAGGRQNDQGYNPLVDGDDDGTVSVESTRLPGASDFAVTAGLHSFLMMQQDVIDMTLCFLQTGRLVADREPHRIPRPEQTETAE